MFENVLQIVAIEFAEKIDSFLKWIAKGMKFLLLNLFHLRGFLFRSLNK